MLKFIVTDIDTVDEAHRSLYEADGTGNHILKVEGAVPKKQLDDFRENNVKLKEKLEKYAGIDPDKIDDFIGAHRKIKDGTYVESTKKADVDKLVEQRVKEMSETHKSEIEKATTATATMKRELETVKINNELLKAGGTAGLRKGAEDDLLYRGRSVFSLNDQGALVALDEKGEVRYGVAGQPLTPDEYVKDLTKKAPHLFSENQGGGGGGGGGGTAGAGGTNPWKKDSYNFTEQMKLMKESPDKARQLAAQAGVTLAPAT